MDDEKRILQNLIDLLQDRVNSAADATGIFSKTLSKTEEKLRALEKSYKDGAQGMDELAKSIKDGSESALDNIGAFKSFQSNLLKSGKSIDTETQARINYIRRAAIGESVMTGFLNTTQAAAVAMVELSISGIKTLVQELQGTGNAFSLVTKLSTQTIDATNKVSQAAAEGATSLGAVLTVALPGQFKFFGAGLIAVGQLLGFLSNKAADLAKFGVETLNAEVQKTIKVFADNSKAGIFFGAGMSALAKEITDAGLSYRDFMGALKNSAADLATLGGSAGAGAMKVNAVFKSIVHLREQFLNLGVSVEEQIEHTASYLAMLARSNSLRGKSDADLAKGLDAYITNLKIITSITGEEAKSAESRARKAAEQLAVQQTIIDLQAEGGDAAVKFQNMVKRLGPELTVALQQLLTGNTIANPALAVALSQAPGYLKILQKSIQDIRNPAVSATDALKNYDISLQENGDVLTKELKKAAEGMGNAANLVGAHAEASAAVSAIQRDVIKRAQGEATDAAKLVNQTKNTNDELTTSVSKATLEFQKMQAKLEQDLNPAIVNFAKFVKYQIEETTARIQEAITKALGPPKPPAPPVGTQQAANAATASAAAATAAGSSESQALSARAVQEQFAANAQRQKEIAERKKSQPQKAEGGITSGATTVGESGPEAVIPLKTTSIPVNIDWGPLMSAIREQTELSKDMLDKLSDIKDYTDKTARNTA